MRVIYILEVIYWWANYLLLTAMRIFLAPIIGAARDHWPALYSFILDILLIILSTTLYLFTSQE